MKTKSKKSKTKTTLKVLAPGEEIKVKAWSKKHTVVKCEAPKEEVVEKPVNPVSPEPIRRLPAPTKIDLDASLEDNSKKDDSNSSLFKIKKPTSFEMTHIIICKKIIVSNLYLHK